MITAAEAQLFSSLRAEGATVAEAVQVIELAMVADQVSQRFGIRARGVIELASWEHEARGPGGRWIKSGADLMAEAERDENIRHIARQQAIEIATKQDIAYEARFRAEQAERDARQNAQIRALQRQIKSANQHMAELEEKQESGKARTKSLAVISSLIGGAVLGAVEAKIGGIPDILAIFSSIGPALIESLFEWKKKL